MDKITKATVSTFEVRPQEGSLSGLKTVIGVLLIAAAHSLDALNDVAMMLPSLSWIEAARGALEVLIEYGESALEVLGSGFLGFGLIDKARKFLKGVFA